MAGSTETGTLKGPFDRRSEWDGWWVPYATFFHPKIRDKSCQVATRVCEWSNDEEGVARWGFQLSTPWKINMEPTNHPFRKEHDLPNLQGLEYLFFWELLFDIWCDSPQKSSQAVLTHGDGTQSLAAYMLCPAGSWRGCWRQSKTPVRRRSDNDIDITVKKLFDGVKDEQQKIGFCQARRVPTDLKCLCLLKSLPQTLKGDIIGLPTMVTLPRVWKTTEYSRASRVKAPRQKSIASKPSIKADPGRLNTQNSLTSMFPMFSFGSK